MGKRVYAAGWKSYSAQKAPDHSTDWHGSTVQGAAEIVADIPDDIARVISVDMFSEIIREQNAVDRANGVRIPSPTINQVLDLAPLRRRIAPVMTGAILRIAGAVRPDEGYPATHADAMIQGGLIFGQLKKPWRDGLEDIISPAARTEVATRAAHIQSTALLIGRGVTALLAAGGHPAYRASSEAVMSLELNAIEYLQQVESDTPPPSATIEESAA